ncbi:MAG: chromosomal replication initiator protein DnaA [Actinobacteria bacterium]|nr:chromosomal replication initiator protein DnaA [Actinomycetota bacterium]
MGSDAITREGQYQQDQNLVWNEILHRLKEEIPTSYFDSVISSLWPQSLDNGTYTICVPSSFTKEVIVSRYLHRIEKVVCDALGKKVEIVLSISDQVTSKSPALKDNTEESPRAHPVSAAPLKKFTFENFVVGDSNKFAYSAALMVAEFPGHNYNPLFIYGATGLGKTHLLYAIQDYAEKMTPNIKVKYIQTSKFIDEFIATLTLKRDKAMFDQKYINNKIVLFDDVHALSSTDAIQSKFFDIFNLLYSSNSHIVLSSDRPPSEIPQLSDRIRSRFEGGLMIDIKPPDIETRLAILRMKVRNEDIEFPDDALVYIASKVKDNIRTLEGLFNRVLAYARLYGTKVDLHMVQEVLKDQISESSDRRRTPTVELIQSLVSNYYQIPKADLVGKSRSRPLVHARQVAMYLCRESTDETLISIGGQFGGRDHTTVLHSCRKIESLIRNKREIFEEVTGLTNMITKAT